MDEDGYLFISDRAKDMIISGGVNIYPAEVEGALAAHQRWVMSRSSASPTLNGVSRSKQWWKWSMASNRPTSSATELVRFCRERLGRYKCPRSVDFRENLPRTDGGKFSSASYETNTGPPPSATCSERHGVEKESSGHGFRTSTRSRSSPRPTTRRFLDEHQSRTDVRRVLEEAEPSIAELWQRGAELGWTAMLVPEEYGGGSVTAQPLVDLVGSPRSLAGSSIRDLSCRPTLWPTRRSFRDWCVSGRAICPDWPEERSPRRGASVETEPRARGGRMSGRPAGAGRLAPRRGLPLCPGSATRCVLLVVANRAEGAW